MSNGFDTVELALLRRLERSLRLNQTADVERVRIALQIVRECAKEGK